MYIPFFPTAFYPLPARMRDLRQWGERRACSILDSGVGVQLKWRKVNEITLKVKVFYHLNR